MKQFLCLIIAAMFLVTEATAAEPKIYALVVSDATPSAQWGKFLPNITLDVLAIHVMLWEGVPPEQLELITLTLEEDSDAKPATILAALDELKPKPEDTLLVYFTGHGAADDRGHYFSLTGGKLYREDLKRQMLNQKARLTILLSDCCNVRGDGRAYMAPAPQVKEPGVVTPIFASLFLKPAGVVDLNGSSPGESAFFTPSTKRDGLPGSLFTTALADYVRANRTRSPDWNELLKEVGMRVHLAFRTGYPDGATIAKGGIAQRDQTVYAIEYPGMPEKEGPRTGIKVRDKEGRGAWIFAVDASSPTIRVFDVSAHKYFMLEPGQLIVAANGHAVTGANDLAAIVKSSPQILRFTLSDSTGTKECLMRLRY